MNLQSISSELAGLPVPEIRYFNEIGSTNDEAMQWAAAGAEDGCLVVADSQTKGRGRLDRLWITRPGAALAFSLILRPAPSETGAFSLFSPLGALAICQALEDLAKLAPEIKWPNDVLLNRRKAAGILVEAAWMGSRLQHIIVGIGLNVTRAAVPPDSEVMFPAISVEEAAAAPVSRTSLLRSILLHLFEWRGRTASPEFFKEWERRLAFRNEWVRVSGAEGQAVSGKLVGIDPSGALILDPGSGETAGEDNRSFVKIQVGDLHLRLMDQ